MTLGIDSEGQLSFAANQSIVPVGTIRSVLILITDNGTSSDQVSAPTINGVAMDELAGSPFAPGLTEPAVHHAFFMDGVPSGTLDVDFSGTPTQSLVFYVAFSADGETEVLDTSTNAAGSGTTASVTVNGDAAGVYGVAILQSNVGVTSGITPNAGHTQIGGEADFGNQVGGCIRTTNLVTTTPTFSISWTVTSDDWMVYGVTVREVAALAVAVGQASETDTAQAVTWAPKIRLIAQAVEADTAQIVTPQLANNIAVDQATETDTAQAVTPRKTVQVGQATETDTAQAIAIPLRRLIGQASETDTAQAIAAVQPPPIVETAVELDRAQQVAVVGGQLVISEVPVLIRAPSRAGRIFHEFVSPSGVYHPNIAGFSSEEEAPGGFGPASGRISERIFRAHHDVFVQGAAWYVWHEDGTCLHSGILLPPDTSQGEVQLVDRGAASKADREVGPILYQTHVGEELGHISGKSRKWSAEFTRISHSFVDSGVLFHRDSVDDSPDGGVQVVVPLFGREPAFLRAHVQGSKAAMTIFTASTDKGASVVNSAELDITDLYENFFLNFTPVTTVSGAEIEVDLTLGGNNLTLPQDELTNVGDPDLTGVGHVYPSVIVIEVGDDTQGSDANMANETEVLISNIEINGAALGERDHFTAHDLVADIAARLGVGFTSIEGGAVGILPYELPAGAPASEALDYAALLTGKRWLIRHNGRRGFLEFGHWTERTWGLASPWAPFDAIPQERFDAVAVPYFYPGRQLDDHVIVRLDNSPLERRNVYWGLELHEPAHNQDKARAVGALIAEQLVRKRNAGSFAAAEVIGPDGIAQTAHHVFAGDTLYPLRAFEPGRLHIARLTRFEDHVEGEFDGENRALDKMLARRLKRVQRWRSTS